MTTQKRKLLRARVALSFYEVYGRRPTEQELEQHVKRAQLYYHAIIPAFFERRKQKRAFRQLQFA
jgi:hypothetical protein